MRTENALKKPQQAWIRQIDNSYNTFVPSLTKSEHFISSATLDKLTVDTQKTKAENPDDFRCLVQFGDHKKQLENEELANPYEDEIKAFDNLVKANDDRKVAALKVPEEPHAYKTCEDTPFTFVDSEELLEQMRQKLAVATEIAIDLEHHS